MNEAEVMTAEEIAKRIAEVHAARQQEYTRLATAAAAEECRPLVRLLYKKLLRLAINNSNDEYQLEFCRRRAMLRHEIEFHAYGHSVVDVDKINRRAVHWQARMAKLRDRVVH